MFNCEFCKAKVNDKGFRCFIKRPLSITLFQRNKEQNLISGISTFQIRICNKCLKKKGVNTLETK
jgi:hypothetical protein